MMSETEHDCIDAPFVGRVLTTNGWTSGRHATEWKIQHIKATA